MINTYRTRIKQLQKKMGCDGDRLAELLRKRLREEGDPFKMSAYQAASWFSPDEHALPSADALPFIADVLNTNVGYLLGLHEVQKMMNERLILNVDILRCEKEYERKHEGRSLSKDNVVYNQWYLNILRKKEASHKRIKPFVNLSKALEWDIDYILGLTDRKHWQYYCLERGDLSLFPEGTRLLLDDGHTIATLANNHVFIVENGKLAKKDLPQILARDPKIISGYELLD